MDVHAAAWRVTVPNRIQLGATVVAFTMAVDPTLVRAAQAAAHVRGMCCDLSSRGHREGCPERPDRRRARARPGLSRVSGVLQEHHALLWGTSAGEARVFRSIDEVFRADFVVDSPQYRASLELMGPAPNCRCVASVAERGRRE